MGYGGPFQCCSALRAHPWTRDESRLRVTLLEQTYESMAIRVDHSGRCAVGWSSAIAAQAAGAGGREAVLWVRKPNGTVQRMWLGASPSTAFNSQAQALVRLKGRTIIVGLSSDYAGTMLPMLWTVTDRGRIAQLELPLPSGMASGAAAAISADGRRVLGRCWGEFDFTTCLSVDGQVSRLDELLAAAGVAAASDWWLWGPAAISADGRILAGSGTDADGNDQVWVVELPSTRSRRPMVARPPRSDVSGRHTSWHPRAELPRHRRTNEINRGESS